MNELDGLQWEGEPLDEDVLLGILRNERIACIGLDDNDELNRSREMALEYYRGHVPDIDAQRYGDDGTIEDQRSKAVSTDLADAVETVLPDLMEVFTGGEDGLSFVPVGEEDVEAAEQETDALRRCFFQHNNGFYVLYEGFKEALLMKTGIFHWYWTNNAEYEEFEGEANAIELQEYAQNGLEITSAEPVDEAQGVFAFQGRRLVKPARAQVSTVASNDFGVAKGTIHLRDATYAAMRSKEQRMQDLISEGFDAEKVRMLTVEELDEDEGIEIARDVAYESDDEIEPGVGDLRAVEVMVHYLRADFEGTGTPQIWRITTGNNEHILLGMEKRSRMEFASVCPFPMPHRFYGQSVADKLIQIQQIKTALTRLMLDSGYYSIHQRPVIATEDMCDETLDDLDDNNPGSYIRVKRQGALTAFTAGSLPFDVTGALEYVSTMGEQRTGVVRNAQGLNPDTLHDTKGGMEVLIGAAQKRVRMIARLFAETGVKDMFLGLHDLMRANAHHVEMIRVNEQFVPVNPSAWRRRDDMVIEIGVGSGGRDQDLAGKRELVGLMERILDGQAAGVIDKPIVKAKNVYAVAKSLADRLGEKKAGSYFSDPDAPPDPNEMQEQRGPSPEEMEMQAKQAEMQQTIQLKQMEIQAKAAVDQQALELEDARKRDQMEAEFALKREQMALEMQLKRESMAFGANSSSDLPPIRPGGAVG